MFVHGGHMVHLYGNVDMPLFFLLSGFSLSIAYGKILWKTYGNVTRCSNAIEKCHEPKQFDFVQKGNVMKYVTSILIESSES